MTTIYDVAKRAGVSPGTVSRVINNAENVTANNRSKVENAIKELGYVPNLGARSLRSKSTNSLALILPDITNVFWTTVSRGIEDAAQRRGYSVLLCNTDENLDKQRRYLDIVISQRVDGVIISPCSSEGHHLARLKERGIPTVVMDRYVEGWEVDTVTGNSVAGARMLVKHLIDLGHRQIAVISGQPDISTAVGRVAGYRIALNEADISIDPRLVRYGEFRTSFGERATHQLLDEGLQPTAIFATNSAISIGVLNALEQRGLSVPDDMAVVCFGDFHPDSRFISFLTAAINPAYEIGANAAQLLLSRLESAAMPQPRRVVLPNRLFIRSSSRSQPQETLTEPYSNLLSVKEVEGSLVPSFTPQQVQSFSAFLDKKHKLSLENECASPAIKNLDAHCLLKALRHEESEELTHLQIDQPSKMIYEYVMERKLDLDVRRDFRVFPIFKGETAEVSSFDLIKQHHTGKSVSPRDQVEFAQRAGVDAITVDFSWYPNQIFQQIEPTIEQYIGGSIDSWKDLEGMEPASPLASQLGKLESYIQAVQGTNIGIVANFSSFFDAALLAAGINNASDLLKEDSRFIEALMDRLVDHQAKVITTICNRFATGLTLIIISDNLMHTHEPSVEMAQFWTLFSDRMKRLISPAKEHGKKLAFSTWGNINGLIPLLHETGFDAVQFATAGVDELGALKQPWAGRMALIGGIRANDLVSGNKNEIEAKVKEFRDRLASNGDYIFSSSLYATEEIPPENFVTMARVVQRSKELQHM